MNQGLLVTDRVQGKFGGSRHTGAIIRAELEGMLDHDFPVFMDFSGVEATQSFIDEVVGVLILKHGPNILKRVHFKGCSEELRAVIKFVVISRTNDYKNSQAPPRSHIRLAF